MHSPEFTDPETKVLTPDQAQVVETIRLGRAPTPTPDAPAMPEEVLRRLKEHYGSAEAPHLRALPAAEVHPRPEVRAEKPPAKRLAWKSLTWAAAAAAVVVIAGLQLQLPQPAETFRGVTGPQSLVAVPHYWRATAAHPNPPGQLAHRNIQVLSGDSALPRESTYILMDPATPWVITVENGQETGRIRLPLSAEAEDWAEALQNLEQSRANP